MNKKIILDPAVFGEKHGLEEIASLYDHLEDVNDCLALIHDWAHADQLENFIEASSDRTDSTHRYYIKECNITLYLYVDEKLVQLIDIDPPLNSMVA